MNLKNIFFLLIPLMMLNHCDSSLMPSDARDYRDVIRLSLVNALVENELEQGINTNQGRILLYDTLINKSFLPEFQQPDIEICSREDISFEAHFQGRVDFVRFDELECRDDGVMVVISRYRVEAIEDSYNSTIELIDSNQWFYARFGDIWQRVDACQE